MAEGMIWELSKGFMDGMKPIKDLFALFSGFREV